MFSRLYNFFNYIFGSSKSEPVMLKPSFMNEIVHNLEHLANKDVESILIPRSEMRCVDVNISIPNLINALSKYLHTRILVYEGNKDNIIGFIHIKDVFKEYNNNKNFNVKNLIRKAMYVTDNVSLIKILENMQKNRQYISVVLDEHSGVRGIVTIGDILEVVFGPLKDEHSKFQHQELCKIIDSKNLIISGKVKIHLLEDCLDITFKGVEDVDTIGGAMMMQDSITKVLDFENIAQFKITEFDGRAVRFVKLTLLNKNVSANNIKNKID